MRSDWTDVGLVTVESEAVKVSVWLLVGLVATLSLVAAADVATEVMLFASESVAVSVLVVLFAGLSAVLSEAVTGSGSTSASLISKSTDEWNILLTTAVTVTSEASVILIVLAALSAAVAVDAVVVATDLASESEAVRISVGFAPTSFLSIASAVDTESPDTTLPASLLILSLAVSVSDIALPRSNAVASTTVTGSGSTSSSLISKSTDEWNILLRVESAVTELANALVTLTVRASAATRISSSLLVTAIVLTKSDAVTVWAFSIVSGIMYAVALIDVVGAAVKPIEFSALACVMPDTEAEARIRVDTAAENFMFTRNSL